MQCGTITRSSKHTMKTTTMQFTETELEFIASFLTFSYIKSTESESDDQLAALIGRFKAEESRLTVQ